MILEKKNAINFKNERFRLNAKGCVVGVDEAGRGPLVGAVVAAAVVLDPNRSIEGLKDSKQLSEKKRKDFADKIKINARDYAIAEASSTEIDTLNILQATLLAMQRAVAALSIDFSKIEIDGRHIPAALNSYPIEAIVRGDQCKPAISAASILAKVTRDQQMIHLDQIYPAYGFATHKGYPTRQHLEALAKYGPISIHRKSFKPVRNAMLVSL